MKLSVIYDAFDGQSPTATYFNQIEPILRHIMSTSPSHCVRMYECEFMGEYSRNWCGGNQDFVIHYCIMDRLQKLTEDEKKVFHSLISHEDGNIEKDLSTARVKGIIEGLSKGLDFDEKEVMLFCQRLRESSLVHSDLHPRNVMKCATGQFKLIDFDRATIQH
jgi:serine/threonine protein kinase